MRCLWLAVLACCLACSPAGGARTPQSPAGEAIAIVPLELVVDKDVPARRVALHADGAITIDGERRATVSGATIRGDAGVITAHPGGRVTASRSNQDRSLTLAFGNDDDLLAPSGEGIHIDGEGKVWNASKGHYDKSDGHFVRLPAGARRTAALLVLSLMLFTPKALEPSVGAPGAPAAPASPP